MIKLLTIRPCTIADIANITGLNPSEVGKYLEHLFEGEWILRRERDGEEYYYAGRKG